MSVIDCFIVETPDSEFTWLKGNVLSLNFFIDLDQIIIINIFYMVISKHPKMIEGRRWLISKYVPDPEEAAEYDVVDDDGADLGGVDKSGFGEVGVSTGVAA